MCHQTILADGKAVAATPKTADYHEVTWYKHFPLMLEYFSFMCESWCEPDHKCQIGWRPIIIGWIICMVSARDDEAESTRNL